MCIRDSAEPYRNRRADQSQSRVSCTEQLLLLPGSPLHALSCLLYTSDAADERSSVDLGGRRIIKKKKPEQHESM